MSADSEAPFDESERPVAPRFTATHPSQAGSSHLKAIHDHHRQQLALLQALFLRLDGREDSASEFAAAIGRLSMAENLNAFGTVCGQECQALIFHHRIEDGSMFPALRRSPELDAVIDRLMKEHEIVHHRVVDLFKAAESLVAAPDDEKRRARAGKALERLHATILSHFGYEEDSLLPAIDHYGVLV